MKLFLVVISLIISVTSWGQKPFVGKLTYAVTIVDTSLQQAFPPTTMVIYTNDTLLRVETTTDLLGEQVMIHHIQKNKSYLLVHTLQGKFAIQIPEDEQATSQKYSFKKAKGTQLIATFKAKKLTARAQHLNEDLTVFYTPKISAKYLPGFEHLPGLPLDYYSFTKDGLYHHRIVKIEPLNVHRDLFGVPSDYTRISMSDFITKVMIGGKE